MTANDVMFEPFEYIVDDVLGRHTFRDVYDIQERNGHLLIYGFNGGTMAIYAPGQWKSVERKT